MRETSTLRAGFTQYMHRTCQEITVVGSNPIRKRQGFVQINTKNKRNLQIAIGISIIVFLMICNTAKIPSAVITLLVLGMVCILFVSEVVPLGVTAVCVPLVLNIAGAIDAKTAFSGLSNENVVLFVAMFIVGGAIFRTGVAKTIGEVVVLCAKGNRRRLLLYVMIATGVLSSVLSNSGCVAVLLPVCIGIADAAKWDRKNLLMPLAMMASLGGTITLVGTPPNITVASVLKTFGYKGFGFFEYAYIGIPLSIAGGALLLLIYGRNVSSNKFETTGVSFESIMAIKFNRKQKTALLVLLGVVVAMATGVINLAIAATIGALICFVTKIVSGAEALEDIDWTTIFLFVGTLPMAEALEKTGAGKMIADAAVHLMGDQPSDTIVLSVVFLIACALTQFMSNTASAALLAPIGIQIAITLNADPHGILMAIGIASSSAFATPMATPPNTLVLGPSNAKFTDYMKSGLPLMLISYVTCMAIIPKVWPF